jgi:hypothetical protein
VEHLHSASEHGDHLLVMYEDAIVRRSGYLATVDNAKWRAAEAERARLALPFPVGEWMDAHPFHTVAGIRKYLGARVLMGYLKALDQHRFNYRYQSVKIRRYISRYRAAVMERKRFDYSPPTDLTLKEKCFFVEHDRDFTDPRMLRDIVKPSLPLSHVYWSMSNRGDV